MRSFVKIKSRSRNGEIPLSFTDAGKSCPSREFLTRQICLLTLFAKIKFSRKFPNTFILFQEFKHVSFYKLSNRHLIGVNA